HAADVARAAHLLLSAEGIAGESYNGYDRYVSEFEVASIAKHLSGAKGAIIGSSPAPKHEIVTAKLRSLGMEFGGLPLLERTIQAILDAPESS
ncbi:NAD-dependent epimerase/dehydratase family protein, partial [Singulisphaera rosea]